MKRIDEIQQLIAQLEKPASEADPTVECNQELLQSLRVEMCKLIGVEKEAPEDEFFSISSSRDERGHSFLLVAVLCNDVETVKTCLRLGADTNEQCSDGLTPMSVASFFNMRGLLPILEQRGGKVSTTDEPWLLNILALGQDENRMDWETILQIANRAAKACDQEKEVSAAVLEENEKSRMHILTNDERHSRHLIFFDSCLSNPDDANSIRRQILLEKSVYSWFLGGQGSKYEFLEFLSSLLPEKCRERDVKRRYYCHRRAVIGIAAQMQYEVLAVALKDDLVVLLTPFVTNTIEGSASVGVLVWAVCPDSFASFYKTLIQNMEFLRNKVDHGDTFPGHVPFTMELGKDMHLLDLKSTNIYTSCPATLFVVDVDDEELKLMEDPSYSLKKRVLDYEEKIAKALFNQSEAHNKNDKVMLSAASHNVSTILTGGAGTGKTLMLTKKVISEPAHENCLVVTRLSRLLSLMKNLVEKEREARNVRFITYDDLMAELAYKVSAPEGESRRFAIFSQVQFGDTSSTGEVATVSFVQEFVGKYLTEAERKRMKSLNVEALTLYTAVRTIKSNSRCLEKQEPLSREAYLLLPETYTLDSEQRSLVYQFYERYQKWLVDGNAKWDEADR